MTLKLEGPRNENETLAFWVTGPGRGELRHETIPTPSGSEAQVQTLYSGISRGTEALVFQGEVPRSEYERMRAPFQGGQFPAPVKYGYASVGQVLRGPQALCGKTVFCLHPHQERFVVPAEALCPLPASVPPQRAVLAANMETAVNALWDSGAGIGERVSVIGAGSVGCLCAWLATRIPGSDVELIDINPERAATAKTLGVRFADPAHAQADADVVLHASGSAAGLALALRIAAFEATVLELSWYGARRVDVPLGAEFHSRRLTLKSSQVGSIADTRRARWTHRRRLELALSLLSDAALDCLINSEGHFRDLPQTMCELARSPSNALLHRVVYD